MRRGGRFRLDSVLRVARIRERQAEKSLAERARDERRAEEALLERTAAYEVRPAPASTSADDFGTARQTSELRARSVTEADAARRAAGEQMEAARDHLLHATRRRRTIEELEDRHHAANAMIASQAAQRALDDLARKRRADAGADLDEPR